MHMHDVRAVIGRGDKGKVYAWDQIIGANWWCGTAV
jgi:hypothetical protein